MKLLMDISASCWWTTPPSQLRLRSGSVWPRSWKPISWPGGFLWRKGREIASYTHWKKGYQLQLLVRSDAEGRRVVEQVLILQNDSPDWGCLINFQFTADLANAYPTVPEVENVYRTSRRLPRQRPVADIRFQYAALHVEDVPNPIILADRTPVLSVSLVS